jgi:hypothetical protein
VHGSAAVTYVVVERPGLPAWQWSGPDRGRYRIHCMAKA